VAPDVVGKLLALLPRPLDAEPLEEPHAILFGERRKVALGRRRRIGLDILDPIARGDQAETLAILREALQQRAQALVLRLAGERRGRRILQRLEAIED
jgi:hypothetical protein